MKAAVFYGKNDLRVEDVPLKAPGPGEVLIRVKACGLCGTDLHIFAGDEGSAKVIPPLVLGHEFSGVVQEVGSGVSEIRKGDRVCADPNIMCGDCYYCRTGRENFCSRHDGMGTTTDGAFSEYITVKAGQVYAIPDSMSFEEAAMVEPVSCCLNGIQLTGIVPGDTVMVIGGGPIGLRMIQLARSLGAACIILSEPVEWKRTLAQQLGAHITINPVTDSVEEVLTSRGIRNPDKVIECADRKETMEDAVRFAGKGGTVMLFGLTSPSAEISLRPYELFRKELTIRSSFINPYTFERAIALIASGAVKVKDIITDSIPLDEINRVFEEDHFRQRGKIIITM